jgi:hypothetical protein
MCTACAVEFGGTLYPAPRLCDDCLKERRSVGFYAMRPVGFTADGGIVETEEWLCRGCQKRREREAGSDLVH